MEFFANFSKTAWKSVRFNELMPKIKEIRRRACEVDRIYTNENFENVKSDICEGVKHGSHANVSVAKECQSINQNDWDRSEVVLREPL